MSIITWQDFSKAGDKAREVAAVLTQHKASTAFITAVDADAYDRQCNTTISNYVKTILSASGSPLIDITASNNKIVSNFFRRFNTQRNTYSLGNGVTFPKDGIKKRLGADFDTRLQEAGYKALVHGVSFMFWNVDRLHVFPLTEFAPIWDESTGALMAGVRFWQIAADKPLYAVLYEPDGYTRFCGESSSELKQTETKHGYRKKVLYSPALGAEVIAEDNYSALPIVPLWGSRLRQSTLVGMKSGIDSFDLIRSGFANDLTDCAQIYWIIDNCGGMNEKDLAAFRERLLFRHIASVNADDGVKVTPYTQELPFQARSAYLDRIRAGLYEDFGALDVSSITGAAKTATEIDAAYQPLDENADDYEYQLIECVRQLLVLQGIDGEEATPQFKRNRVSNQLEQVQMIAMEAPYLDDETILNKLPNITPDEVKAILAKKDAENADKFSAEQEVDDDDGRGAQKDRPAAGEAGEDADGVLQQGVQRTGRKD